MPVVLSAVISPNVTLEVTGAGLPSGAGGVALRFTLHDGPLAFTLTDQQARELCRLIDRRLAGAATEARSDERSGCGPGQTV